MQGYVTLATGKPEYLDMATNLAASVRVMDPARPICLVTDPKQTITPLARSLFSDIVVLQPDPLYPPVMEKLRLYDASPYDQSMFVDADCLLVKSDVDFYWREAARSFFAITGDRRTSGEWKGLRIEEVIRQEGAPYLVQMNSGVFYWNRSPEAAAFMAGLDAFYRARRDVLGHAFFKGKRQQSHELYLGIYMGLQGMDGMHAKPAEYASWMVSTWRALSCSVDFASGDCTIRKPTGFLFGLPILPSGWRRLSPTFAHFIGLKPRGTYRRLAARFHSAAAGRAVQPSA